MPRRMDRADLQEPFAEVNSENAERMVITNSLGDGSEVMVKRGCGNVPDCRSKLIYKQDYFRLAWQYVSKFRIHISVSKWPLDCSELLHTYFVT